MMERSRIVAALVLASLVAASTVAAATVAAGAASAPVAGIGAGTEALHRALREHVLHTLDGKTLTLASLRGEVVVVNFWASWCPPCRKELPALASLNRELSGQGRVVAVSIDTDPRNVQRFAKSNHLAMTIAQDGPEGLVKQLDLQSVPFTLVLGRDGEVAMTASGTSELARVQSTAHRLVAVPPPAAEPRSAQTTEGGNP